MYSLARELHMTVGVMLQQMSQKELCHWIAYFKIEQERLDEAKTSDADRPEKQDAASSPGQKRNKSEYTQAQKDGALLSRLFALASCNDL